jgi:hypothetical protein
MKLSRVASPTTSLARVTRGDLDKAARGRAATAKVGTTICVETHEKEQAHPWVLGKVVDPATPLKKDGELRIQFATRRATEVMTRIQLYEGLEPGARTYTLSDHVIEVPSRCVRVVDITMQELPVVEMRRSGRTEARHVVPSVPRFRLADESLDAIKGEMPSASDHWEVETVLQYRKRYGKEQWLIKWKDWPHDRNTWEFWENLLSEEVQLEAAKLRPAPTGTPA